MPDISKPKTPWDLAFEGQEIRNNDFRDMLSDAAKDAVKAARNAARDLNYDIDETYTKTADRTGVKIKTLMQEQVLELLEDFFDIPDPATHADNRTGDNRF